MARMTRSKRLARGGLSAPQDEYLDNTLAVTDEIQQIPTGQNGALEGIDENDADGPSIKLRDIHPDLHPFLRIPHHIPLLCFFDPNRYAPYNTNVPIPPLQPLEVSNPNAENPGSSKQEAPENASDDEEEVSTPGDAQMEDGEPHSAGPSIPIPEINGQETSVAPSKQMNPLPFFFPNSGGQAGTGGSRKKRRCLLCIHAGRLNHAYICPGRGNRAVCATVKEIERAGGSLPAESSKWTSKNTQTPIFVPTPPAVLMYPGLPPLPGPDSPSTSPTIHVAPMGSYPIPPPAPPPPAPSLSDPAPLGFLADGTARQRRPRRCKVCNTKGRDGTLCIGRASSKKCPHFIPGVDDHILGARAATDDQENEELSVFSDFGLSAAAQVPDSTQ
ncbi:hypothetical protein FRB98_000450 [Tulasnella sp. 332]|nr:hypothetical protein FRB98_000450 [Tulasnella sp. 332]